MNKMLSQYVDAHLHLLDKRFAGRENQIVENARKMDVGLMLCNAVTEGDWAEIMALAHASDCVLPFLGIHPYYATSCQDGWEQRLSTLLEGYNGSIGIGESGLDKRSAVDITLQTSLFETHLEMAYQFSLPISVHCVRSWGLLTDILEAAASGNQLPRVMIHAFSGSREMMERLVRTGCFISYTPSIATPAQERVRQVFIKTPIEYLLLETDAPGRAVQLFSGAAEAAKPWCEPTVIPAFYEWAAKERNSDPADFKRHLSHNAQIYTNRTFSR